MRNLSNFTIMSKVLMLSTTIFCWLSLISHPVLGLGLSPAPSPSITNPKNLTILVKEAMNEAIQALHSLKQQLPLSPSMRECSLFYNLTIMDLNQTLQTNLNPTAFDVQIWLSSALTNLDNCKYTLTEQNLSNPIFQQSINRASALIINCLDINGEQVKQNTHLEAYDDELYRWFPDEDLLNLSGLENGNDIVVAQDGSGNYRTIKEGLDAARRRQSKEGVVIYVKQGTYNEYLEISGDLYNLNLVGDGIGKTIITGDRCNQTGFGTVDSATVKVFGTGFVAKGITFRNTGGVTRGQGVALFASADKLAFYRCSFEGYQDTLWVNTNRQFYRECLIYGTIDFIFGNAAVVFLYSNIYARPPQRGQEVVITAQSRTSPREPTGISILNCRVLPDPKFKEELKEFVAYLGRPWRDYARVAYLKTHLDGMVPPQGWGGPNLNNVYFAEYQNCGPGFTNRNSSGLGGGVKVITDFAEANQFSVERFINNHAWLQKTSVPYNGGFGECVKEL